VVIDKNNNLTWVLPIFFHVSCCLDPSCLWT
jgi:hypothetical protein